MDELSVGEEITNDDLIINDEDFFASEYVGKMVSLLQIFHIWIGVFGKSNEYIPIHDLFTPNPRKD